MKIVYSVLIVIFFSLHIGTQPSLGGDNFTGVCAPRVGNNSHACVLISGTLNCNTDSDCVIG